MGARSGQQYLDRLASTRPAVQIAGERLAGPVTEHPLLGRLAQSFAALYDMQLQEATSTR